MATRDEIIETIQHGTTTVQRTFGSLTEEQLQLRVHAGEPGWTAKEVLAHLATRQPVNDLLIQMAAGAGAPLAAIASIDEWNQTLVGERRSASMDALLAQFQAVQEALVAQVQTLPAEALARPIPLPQGEAPLGDVLAMAGGAHATHHADEVAQALARSSRK